MHAGGQRGGDHDGRRADGGRQLPHQQARRRRDGEGGVGEDARHRQPAQSLDRDVREASASHTSTEQRCPQ